MDRAIAFEKKGFRPNPHHDDWLIYVFILSFSPKTTFEAVGVKSPSIDDMLLGLLGPYLWHAISTFKTCSRWPIHRSLTDTDRGYNLGGVDFPHHTPRPSQLMVLRFSPKGPIRSQIIHQHKPLVKVMWSIYYQRVVFWPLGIYRSLYIYLTMSNIIHNE
jgi:hypothetical protein